MFVELKLIIWYFKLIMSDTLELEWHSHANYFQNLIKHLLKSGEESDVTLVCDDQVKLKAHKLILKSCSPVFENILKNDDPVVSKETIYLHGVSHLDMKSILDYIYQGKVSLDKRRLICFKQVARNLQIKMIEELFSGDEVKEPCPKKLKYTLVQKYQQSSKITPKDNASQVTENKLNQKPRHIKKIITPTLELVKNEIIDDVKQIHNEQQVANDTKFQLIPKLNTTETIDKFKNTSLDVSDEFTLDEVETQMKLTEQTKCKKCKQPIQNQESHTCDFSCKEPGCEDIKINTKTSLNFHKYRFHEKMDLACEDCGETFKHTTFFKRHKRILCKEAKLPVCKICGKSFRKMKQHMAQHIPDEQRDFVCHIGNCGKGFPFKRLLDKHTMNVHLKLRPYKCRYGCEFGYNDSSNRDSHERKRHGKLFCSLKRVQQEPKTAAGD